MAEKEMPSDVSSMVFGLVQDMSGVPDREPDPQDLEACSLLLDHMIGQLEATGRHLDRVLERIA